jgi:hypothetical protein
MRMGDLKYGAMDPILQIVPLAFMRRGPKYLDIETAPNTFTAKTWVNDGSSASRIVER